MSILAHSCYWTRISENHLVVQCLMLYLPVHVIVFCRLMEFKDQVQTVSSKSLVLCPKVFLSGNQLSDLGFLTLDGNVLGN